MHRTFSFCLLAASIHLENPGNAVRQYDEVNNASA
jgi:hypothetical protein